MACLLTLIFFSIYYFYFFHWSWFTVFSQFILYSKVTICVNIYTHTHTHTYILFLTLSSIMFYHKWLDIYYLIFIWKILSRLNIIFTIIGSSVLPFVACFFMSFVQFSVWGCRSFSYWFYRALWLEVKGNFQKNWFFSKLSCFYFWRWFRDLEDKYRFS